MYFLDKKLWELVNKNSYIYNMKINKGTILVWKYKIPHYVVDGGAKAEVTKDYNGEEFIYIKWLDETKHLSYGQMDGGYHLNYFIIDSNKSNQLKLKL